MLNKRIKIAIDRLKAFEPQEGYYVAYSGGKDSDVILNLIRMSGCKYDGHYNNTTIDNPEIIYHVRQQRDVVIEQPPTPFLVELLKKHRGIPTRQMRWCCAEYKEKGGIGRVVVTGIRKQESHKRAKRQMVESCYKENMHGKRYLNVIIDWTSDDVWDFIKSNNIQYCSLYDVGFNRLGCLFCPNKSPKIKRLERQRYPRHEKLFIKYFHKFILDRRTRGLKCFAGMETGREIFDWWVSGKSIAKYLNVDQTVMFE